MTSSNIDNYKLIQSQAKKVLQDITAYLKPGVTEKNIVATCFTLFKQLGIEESWYHNVMAFVLIGERTTLSISGRKYLADNNNKLKANDLVTIDVSPVLQGCWGDCSRSYVIHDGQVFLDEPSGLKELDHGVITEIALHQYLKEIATPEMTLSELYELANHKIKSLGYKNLDFKGNLGHTIEKELSARKFIENGDQTPLADLNLFTFEPHICHQNNNWGFKRENIYYFDQQCLVEL